MLHFYKPPKINNEVSIMICPSTLECIVGGAEQGDRTNDVETDNCGTSNSKISLLTFLSVDSLWHTNIYLSKLCLSVPTFTDVPTFSKLCLFVPTFTDVSNILNCAHLCLLSLMYLLFLICAYLCILSLFYLLFLKCT